MNFNVGFKNSTIKAILGLIKQYNRKFDWIKWNQKNNDFKYYGVSTFREMNLDYREDDLFIKIEFLLLFQ